MAVQERTLVEMIREIGAAMPHDVERHDVIHVALNHMGEAEQIEFLCRLHELWRQAVGGRQSEVESELAAVGIDRSLIGNRLMWTVTATREQLRCWYGIPAHLGPDHVDGADKGMLYQRKATPQFISRLIKALNLERWAIPVPNGCTIYMSWRSS